VKDGLVLLVAAASAYAFYAERAFLFEARPAAASRMTYGLNPFPESVAVASYIRERASEQDRIAILGSEPQILFYSGRLSATGHIYMYGLMERQKYALQMQQEMIREVEASSPKFVVLVNVPTSWLVTPASPRLVLDWMDRYLAAGYRVVGIVDIFDADLTIYRWDEAASNYSTISPYNIFVFQRK